MLDYQNSALPIEIRVKDLLSRMTLAEKAAQTCMLRGVEYATRPSPLHNCSVEPDTDFHLKLPKEEAKIVRYILQYYEAHNHYELMHNDEMNLGMKEWRLKVATVLEHVLFLFPPCKEVE